MENGHLISSQGWTPTLKQLKQNRLTDRKRDLLFQSMKFARGIKHSAVQPCNFAGGAKLMLPSAASMWTSLSTLEAWFLQNLHLLNFRRMTLPCQYWKIAMTAVWWYLLHIKHPHESLSSTLSIAWERTYCFKQWFGLILHSHKPFVRMFRNDVTFLYGQILSETRK